MAGDWRVDLLQAIGAPVTADNLRFLAAWQRQEGGHTNNAARWNWLNVTGGPGRSINSVGVRAFPTYGVGIQSTAAFLENGRYPSILAGLREGSVYRAGAGVAGDLSTWVSGSRTGGLTYAGRVLGSQVAPPVGGASSDPAGVTTPAAASSCSATLAVFVLAIAGGVDLLARFLG